jgi:predicted acyltransferase
MRLTSLDVFRGITIAGMILVNMASLSDTYPLFKHADWSKGYTPADLVFPAFLFVVGAAMAFSLAKYITGMEKIDGGVYGRIIRRSGILFALGIFLNGFWNYDWANLRWLGVLQRIAIAFLITAILVLNIPKKGLYIISAILLIGYWLINVLVPAPDGLGGGMMSQTGNFAAYVDRLIIPKAHLYKGDGYNFLGDPEGLFSTLPAVVSVLCGYFTGAWLKHQNPTTNNSIRILMFGLAALVIGTIWGQFFPIDKRWWSSSYVVVMTGWSLLGFAACYELVDVRGYRKWFRPFEVLGLNAIVAFVASVLAIKLLMKNKIGTGAQAIAIYEHLKNMLFGWAGNLNSGLLFAIATVIFWTVICYLLYWKRWFVKV